MHFLTKEATSVAKGSIAWRKTPQLPETTWKHIPWQPLHPQQPNHICPDQPLSLQCKGSVSEWYNALPAQGRQPTPLCWGKPRCLTNRALYRWCQRNPECRRCLQSPWVQHMPKEPKSHRAQKTQQADWGLVLPKLNILSVLNQGSLWQETPSLYTVIPSIPSHHRH